MSNPLLLVALEEHSTSVPFEVAPAVRDALRTSLPPGIALDVVLDRPHHYCLAAGSVAGVIECAGIRIEIRPKVPVQSLLFLVGYAINRRVWQDSLAFFDPTTALVDAVAAAAARQILQAIARGRLHGYVADDTLQTVRGRIQISAQISRWQGRTPPVEVTFHEFTDDILEHRLLKAATGAMLRWPIRQPATWQALRHIDVVLAPVSAVHFPPCAVPTVLYTRLNEHYRTAVELSRLVLRLSAFEARGGRVRAAGLLVDMNHIFQDFVEVALREALSSSGVSLRAQDQRFCLDAGGGIPLRPDLVFERFGKPVLVGDAKYKRLEASGLANADVYQTLAYATALGVERAVLIYPATEAARNDYAIRNTSKTVSVRTVNLALPPTELLNDILRIAEEIWVYRAPLLA